MNIDTEAQAILDEFKDARRMAATRFNRQWRYRMNYDEATSYIDIRLLVFAGLMETNHVTGRDSDAGKLPKWREIAAGMEEPRIYLRAIIITKLISDLVDSVKTRKRDLPPWSIELQREIDVSFDIPAEDTGIDYWNAHYADSYPILTAIYRDKYSLRELKAVMHRGYDSLAAQRDTEMAELRAELV